MPEMIPIAPALAEKAEKLFRELGLDLQTAINLFLLQSLRENGLPFTPRLTGPAVPDKGEAQHICESPSEANVPAPSAAIELSNESPTPPPAPLLAEETPEDSPEYEADQEYELESEHFAPADASQVFNEDASLSVDSPESRRIPESRLSALRQAFHNMGLMGMPLRRIRSLNQIYAMGQENPHVPGWRESYISGDEPFTLDFGSLRIELGFHDGGSLRVMDGRLPDEVLEADAVFPRDLSALFSPIIGQRLTDAEAVRMRRREGEAECLRLHFSNGCTLTFAPGDDWGALWLHDQHGAVMFAPDTLWRRALGERTWQALR